MADKKSEKNKVNIDENGLLSLHNLANKGIMYAQCKLGFIYGNGRGVPTDYQKALYWYQMAAVRGNPDAQFKVGLHHDFGLGVEPNQLVAFSWYKQAADQGHAIAQYNLGELCESRQTGLIHKDEEAFNWYTLAANQEYPPAQFKLGMFYFEGKWVDKNYDKALSWFEKAADLGDKLAKISLNIFATELGLAKDEKKKLGSEVNNPPSPPQIEMPSTSESNIISSPVIVPPVHHQPGEKKYFQEKPDLFPPISPRASPDFLAPKSPENPPKEQELNLQPEEVKLRQEEPESKSDSQEKLQMDSQGRKFTELTLPSVDIKVEKDPKEPVRSYRLAVERGNALAIVSAKKRKKRVGGSTQLASSQQKTEVSFTASQSISNPPIEHKLIKQEIINPSALSKKQIFSFLQPTLGRFSQYSEWLNRQSDPLQAAAHTLQAFNTYFGEIPQLTALQDLVKFITEKFIIDLKKLKNNKSISLANIFEAANSLIDSIEALGSKLNAQKQKTRAQIQQKIFTWPFAELLKELANLSKKNAGAEKLSTKLSLPKLIACARQFQGTSKFSTLEELGSVLGYMGLIENAQCLTGRRVNVEFITRLAINLIEEAEHNRSEPPEDSTILNLLMGSGMLAAQGHLNRPLPIDHINKMLNVLTEKELYFHQQMLLEAILGLQQLFETRDKPSINGKDFLDIKALEEILCNFTDTEPPPGDLVSVLRALKSLFNEINSPYKLHLKPLTDVLQQIDSQDNLGLTSIARGRVIGEALLYVGQIMQNRPYLSKEIDNSSLVQLTDNLQKKLLKIVASNPPDALFIKYAIFSLSGAALMGKTSATDTTKELAKYVLKHLEQMKFQFSKDHYAANCNQLAHYLYFAGEPQKSWPGWLTEAIKAQKPKELNPFQKDLAKELKAEGFKVRLEKRFGYTHTDVYAEKDGVRFAFEINPWFHVSSRTKIKKDKYRKKALEFRKEVDWVRNINIWKKRFSLEKEIELAEAKVKELKNSKKEVKDRSSEPLTKTKELYQYIANSVIPQEELPPEKIPSTAPAYKLPPVAPTITESSTPLVEIKRDRQEQIPAAVRQRKAQPAYQLMEFAEQGNIDKLKTLLGAGSPKNPYTDKPDRYTLVVALMVAIQKESMGGPKGLKDVIEYLVNRIGPNELFLEKFNLSPWIVAHQGGEKTKWVSDYIENFIYQKLEAAIIKETKKLAKQQRKGEKLAPPSEEDLPKKKAEAKKLLENATTRTETLAASPIRPRILFRNEASSQQAQATYKPPSQPEFTATPTDGKALLREEVLSQPVQDADKPPSEQKLTYSGSALDRYNLGTRYYKGIGVEKDVNEAVSLFRSAANDGFAAAQFSLAMCYQAGEGVEENPEEAVKFYQLAAEQGHPLAQTYLGICYRDNIGVEKDLEKAVDWFKKAADQENPEAQFHLGLCYKNGSGLSKNSNEAARLFQLADDQGNAEAQYHLGLCYETGEGVVKDQQRAVRLFQLSVEQGNANSQYRLGLCYQNGVGVKKSKTEATRLFKLAAKQGNLEAFNCLGESYQMEEKLKQTIYVRPPTCSILQDSPSWQRGKKKPRKSAANLQKLSDQGDVDATYRLALRCINGEGLQQDLEEGYRLMESAASQEHNEAKLFLDTKDKLLAQYDFYFSRANQQRISSNKLDNKVELVKELNPQKNLKESIENICRILLNGGWDAMISIVSPNFQKNLQDTMTILKKHIDPHHSKLNQSTSFLNGSAESKPSEDYFPVLSGNSFDQVADLFMDPKPDIPARAKAIFKPFEKFADLLESVAKQGNPYAQYGLACCYQEGVGVKENWHKSVQWLRLAAEQGHFLSQIGLGDCYRISYGLGKDTEKALNWYKKAVQQSEIQGKSQETMAKELFLNVSQLLAEEIMDQFHDGSANVSRPGLVMEAVSILQTLGKFKTFDDLPSLSQKRVVTVITGNAKENFFAAVCSLVMKKSNKENELNEDQETIRKVLEELLDLAEFGNSSDALYTLALFFGAVQSEQGKNALLKRAAENNNAKAQFAFAQCARTKNEKHYWYGKAAVQKNVLAIVELAKLNYDKEPGEAIICYKEAARRGNIDGLVLLARAYYEDILDEEKARNLSRLVIEQGAANKLPFELSSLVTSLKDGFTLPNVDLDKKFVGELKEKPELSPLGSYYEKDPGDLKEIKEAQQPMPGFIEQINTISSIAPISSSSSANNNDSQTGSIHSLSKLDEALDTKEPKPVKNLKKSIDSIIQLILSSDSDWGSLVSILSSDFIKNLKNVIEILKQHIPLNSELKPSSLSVNGSVDSKLLGSNSPALNGDSFGEVAHLFMPPRFAGDFIQNLNCSAMEDPNQEQEKIVFIQNNSENIKNIENLAKEFAHLLKSLAELGNPDAQYGLARCYQTGFGLEINWQKSTRWLRLAAENGHLLSQIRLGDCHGRYTNYGLRLDDEEALSWYKKAIQQPGVQSNSKEAIAILLKVLGILATAISLEKPSLINEAVSILKLYLNLEPDSPNWKRRIEVIADKKKLELFTSIVHLVMGDPTQPHPMNEASLEDQYIETQKTIEKVLKRLINLAEFNNSDAQYTLALFLGIKKKDALQAAKEKDDPQATKEIDDLLKLAAVKNSNSTAQIYLGECCPGDKRGKAFFWYSLAETQGEGYASVCLGKITYLRGDYEGAVNWDKRAASRGNLDGLRYLANAYNDGEGAERNVETAMKLSKLVAEQDSTYRMPDNLSSLMNESKTKQTPLSLPMTSPKLTQQQLDDLETLGISREEIILQEVINNPRLIANHYGNLYLDPKVTINANIKNAYKRLSQSAPFFLKLGKHKIKLIEKIINNDLKTFNLSRKESPPELVPLQLAEAYEAAWKNALAEGRKPLLEKAAYERLCQFEKLRYLPSTKTIVGLAIEELERNQLNETNENWLNKEQEEENQLSIKAAKKYGLKLHNVDNRGNCFFESVSDQLKQNYGVNISADHLRIIAMLQMRSHAEAERYANFLVVNLDFNFSHLEDSTLNKLDHSKLKVAPAIVCSLNPGLDVSGWSIDKIFNFCREPTPASKKTASAILNLISPLLNAQDKINAHTNAMLERVVEQNQQVSDKKDGKREWANDADVLAMSDVLGIPIVSVEPLRKPASRSEILIDENCLSVDPAADEIATDLIHYQQDAKSTPIVLAFTGGNHFQSLRRRDNKLEGASEKDKLQDELIKISDAKKRTGLNLSPLTKEQLNELGKKKLNEVQDTFTKFSASRKLADEDKTSFLASPKSFSFFPLPVNSTVNFQPERLISQNNNPASISSSSSSAQLLSSNSQVKDDLNENKKRSSTANSSTNNPESIIADKNDKDTETLPPSIARSDTPPDGNLLGGRFRVFGSSPSSSIAEISCTISSTVASQNNDAQTDSSLSSSSASTTQKSTRGGPT